MRSMREQYAYHEVQLYHWKLTANTYLFFLSMPIFIYSDRNVSYNTSVYIVPIFEMLEYELKPNLEPHI